MGTGGSSELPPSHLLRFWIAEDSMAVSCATNGWCAVLEVHLYSPFLVRVRALPQINSFLGVPFVCVCDTPQGLAYLRLGDKTPMITPLLGRIFWMQPQAEIIRLFA